MTTPKIIRGWHFTGSTLRNGEPIPPIGEWLIYKGETIPCEQGLHCSEDPFDALQYTPGSILHRVQLRGQLKSHGNTVDKWVGSERFIVASLDVKELLCKFACWNALQVIDKWKAPKVVLDWLNNQDESIRSAAWSAAWSAAASATASAARSAARSAAWSAAWSAARSAAVSAAWSAAWSAAESASKKEFNKQIEKALLVCIDYQ